MKTRRFLKTTLLSLSLLMAAGMGTVGCSSTKKEMNGLARQEQSLAAQAKDLQAQIDELRSKEQADSSLFVQEIKDAEGNKALRLVVGDDLLFPTNSYALSAASDAALSKIAFNLNQYAGTYVTVVGFTDSTGDNAINEPLSRRRAESVENYLEKHGVQASRLMAVGEGSQYPVATNHTAAGRAQNRRVEIYITSARPDANTVNRLAAYR